MDFTHSLYLLLYGSSRRWRYLKKKNGYRSSDLDDVYAFAYVLNSFACKEKNLESLSRDS